MTVGRCVAGDGAKGNRHGADEPEPIRGAFIESGEALLIEDGTAGTRIIGESPLGELLSLAECTTLMCQNYTETRAWRFHADRPERSREVTGLLVDQWLGENEAELMAGIYDGPIPAFVKASPKAAGLHDAARQATHAAHIDHPRRHALGAAQYGVGYRKQG